MAGGLLQLVANGAQDVYITGNPQITFFKIVYRKITPFTIESIKQTFTGEVQPGNKVTVNIDRQGDLLHRIWLNMKQPVDTPSTNTGVNYPISHYLKEFSFDDLGNNYYNHLQISDSAFVNVSFSAQSPDSQLFKAISINISNQNNTSLYPIVIPNSIASPELYTSEFTLSMHFKPSNTNRRMVIVNTLNIQNNTGYMIEITDNNNVKITLGGTDNLGISTLEEIIDNTVVQTDTWYFIAISNEGYYLCPSTQGASSTFNQFTNGFTYAVSDYNIIFARDLTSETEPDYYIGYLSDIRFYNASLLSVNNADIIRTTQTQAISTDTFPSRTDVYRFIEYAEIEIGTQIIDKQYGEWMMIWSDINNGSDKRNMLSALDTGDSTYIPLLFWFCRNPGLALPLISLQYHEVKLNIQFSNLLKNNSNLEVYCDYVFLDKDERNLFAEESQEYLIENVQTLPLHPLGSIPENSSGTGLVDLAFNHPIKELFWVIKDNNDSGLVVDDAIIQLNGHDRFQRKKGNYFTKIQRYHYHTGSENSSTLIPHLYSFAQNPQEYQPSGSCNFSMINDAKLSFNYTRNEFVTGALYARVYALGYNILRIISGMGGLAYAN